MGRIEALFGNRALINLCQAVPSYLPVQPSDLGPPWDKDYLRPQPASELRVISNPCDTAVADPISASIIIEPRSPWEKFLRKTEKNTTAY